MLRMTTVAEFTAPEDGMVLRRIEGACLSTDDKPNVDIASGSVMVETDTGDVYFYDEEEGWIKQFSFQE